MSTTEGANWPVMRLAPWMTSGAGVTEGKEV